MFTSLTPLAARGNGIQVHRNASAYIIALLIMEMSYTTKILMVRGTADRNMKLFGTEILRNFCARPFKEELQEEDSFSNFTHVIFFKQSAILTCFESLETLVQHLIVLTLSHFVY